MMKYMIDAPQESLECSGELMHLAAESTRLIQLIYGKLKRSDPQSGRVLPSNNPVCNPGHGRSAIYRRQRYRKCFGYRDDYAEQKGWQIMTQGAFESKKNFVRADLEPLRLRDVSQRGASGIPHPRGTAARRR